MNTAAPLYLPKQSRLTGVAYHERKSLALNTIAEFFGYQCHRVCEIISSKAPVTLPRIIQFSQDASFGKNSSLVNRGSRYVIGDGDGQVLNMTKDEVAKCLCILIHHGVVFSYCAKDAPATASDVLTTTSRPLFEIDYDSALIWLHMPVYAIEVSQAVRAEHKNSDALGKLAGNIVSHVSTGGSTRTLTQKFLNVKDVQSFHLVWKYLVNKNILVPWKRLISGVDVPNASILLFEDDNRSSGGKNNQDNLYYMLDTRCINVLLRHKVCLDYIKSSKIGARKALISESIVCAVYKAFLKIATTAELNPGAYEDSGDLKWQNTIFVSEKDAFSALDDNVAGVDSTFTWSEKKFKAAVDALCNMRPPALEQYDKGKYSIHISSIVNKLKEELSQSIISQRYGDRSGRIVRMLVELGHLDQKTISDMAMIPMHDTRYDLYQMMQQHVVELHEVPRPPNRTPATTLYFWSTSQKLIKDAAERFTYKSILNLKLRRQKFVAGDNMMVLQMADKFGESYRQLGSMSVAEVDVGQVVRCSRTMKSGKIVQVNDVETKLKTVEIEWTANEEDWKNNASEKLEVGNGVSVAHEGGSSDTSSGSLRPTLSKKEVVPLHSTQHYVHIVNNARRLKLATEDTNRLFRITVIKDRIEITLGRLQKTLMCLTHFNGSGQRPFLYKRKYDEMVDIVEPASGPARKKKRR
eukprot:g8361.t1